jgi:acylphosphatase
MTSVLEDGLEQRGFRITGRVQGVYYRVWTRGVAEGLALQGTVQNRTDGSVESHVLGSPDAVRAFESRLWEGPPAAAVEGVEAIESSNELPGGPFQILPTAL